MKSIPSEYSLFRSIDVSHGMCPRGSMLQIYVESIWIESTYRVHITKLNPPPRVETTSIM